MVLTESSHNILQKSLFLTFHNVMDFRSSLLLKMAKENRFAVRIIYII
jgi:hypothetical protein